MIDPSALQKALNNVIAVEADIDLNLICNAANLYLDSLHRPVEARVTEERRFRHKKRGSTYKLIGWAEAHSREPLTDAEVVAVYWCEQDGNIWVRRKSEFEDGRFEELPAATIPSPQVTREEIAREIDPEAADHPGYYPERAASALLMAESILALFGRTR